jgi:hypothetical protein
MTRSLSLLILHHLVHNDSTTDSPNNSGRYGTTI